MIKIEIDDRAVRQAIESLRGRVTNMKPAMHAIGQALVEGSRNRIRAERDWTGAPFAPNAESTLLRVMRRAAGGKGLRTRRGNTRAAAVRALAAKQPLIDEGDFVSGRLHHEAGPHSVTVGSSAVQAAVLQFGARRGAFGRTSRGAPILWGDIPARRYLPVTGDRRLDEARLAEYLRIAHRTVETGEAVIQVHRGRLQYVFGSQTLRSIAIVDWEETRLFGLYGHPKPGAYEAAWSRRYAPFAARVEARTDRRKSLWRAIWKPIG